MNVFTLLTNWCSSNSKPVFTQEKAGVTSDFTSRPSRFDSLSIVSRQSDLATYVGRIVAVVALIFTLGVGNAWGALTNTYTKITSVGSLSNGDKVVIAMETSSNPGTGVTGQSSKDATVSTTEANWIQYEVTQIKDGSGNVTGWTLYDSSAKKYIKSPGGAEFYYGDTGGECYVNASGILHCNSRFLGQNGNNRRFYATSNIGTYTAFYVWKVTAASTPTLTVSGGATSLAMGDAKVNGSGVSNNTLTFSGSNLSANATLAISGTNASMFSVSPTSVTPSTGTITNQTITVTYSPTSAGDHSATLTISSTGATSKTITLSGIGKYEVTWKCAGSDDVTTLVANGSKPTFPSTPTSCDLTSTTFYGWTASTWSGKIDDISAKTIHTSNSTMSTVTANGTVYHAVFAKGATSGDYIKGTKADLTEGQTVVIVNNNSSNALSSEDDGDGYLLATSVSITSNTITSPSSALIWTVELGSNGGYFFKHGSNYINAYEDNDGDHHLYFDNYTDEWMLTGSGPYVLNSTEDSGYKLYYWSTYSCWDTYTGTGNPYNTDFYVPEVTYSKYLTTCCTELASINGSVLGSNR